MSQMCVLNEQGRLSWTGCFGWRGFQQIRVQRRLPAHPSDSIVTRKGKPLTPCFGSAEGPTCAVLRRHCRNWSRGCKAAGSSEWELHASRMPCILHLTAPSCPFWVLHRHAVVIEPGSMTPSTAESRARDPEGKLWNVKEGSKLSGPRQFETLVLGDRGDRLRRGNIS